MYKFHCFYFCIRKLMKTCPSFINKDTLTDLDLFTQRWSDPSNEKALFHYIQLIVERTDR